MKKLRIGIIGSGFGQYGLFPVFQSLPNCEIVAHCGSSRPQLKKYFKKIGFSNTYTDWQEMLKKEKLDAIAIAVPPEVQYQICKIAIKKGLHIFAEKPLAANLKQARELYKLAKKHKVTTAVDFIFPEIAEWQKVKEIIDKKTYGKLKSISVRWNFLSYDIKNKKAGWKTNSKEGGGALSFFFSHSLNYIENFAGTIQELQSSFDYDKNSLGGGEVGVNLDLKFKNKITGNAEINIADANENNHQLIFDCEKATIILQNKKDVVDNFSIQIKANQKTKTLRVSKDSGKKNEDQRVKEVKKIASRFFSAALAKKQMRPSFKEGLRVQELIELVSKQQI